jgi:hypothetical protein
MHVFLFFSLFRLQGIFVAVQPKILKETRKCNSRTDYKATVGSWTFDYSFLKSTKDGFCFSC